MKTKHVSIYLVSAILTIAILPFLTSYLLIDEIIGNAVSLVVKPKTEQILLDYQQDLKTLRKLIPENEARYKTSFDAISDELVIYQQPELVKKVLSDTYLTYYLLLFIIVLFFSLVAAILLSRKVAHSYGKLMASNTAKTKKILDLSHFDEWQIIAGKLAHEINNPLTPIDMMVSNLSRLYYKADTETFEKNLHDTETVVREEITKLKAMVSHFNKFSKLPEPVLNHCDVLSYLDNFIKQYQSAWQNTELTMIINESANHQPSIIVSLDTILFNQCLLNIINNAVQANQAIDQLSIVISIDIQRKSNSRATINITISNNGASIAPSDREHIFKMYFSGKKITTDQTENMGLGLTIVRKIILDHNGDITCLPVKEGAAFKISLPLLGSKTLSSINEGSPS